MQSLSLDLYSSLEININLRQIAETQSGGGLHLKRLCLSNHMMYIHYYDLYSIIPEIVEYIPEFFPGKTHFIDWPDSDDECPDLNIVNVIPLVTSD